MNNFIIKFVIGDYSTDGHSRYSSIFVESNKPVADVRKAHILENYRIGNLASKYLENTVSLYDIFPIIKDHSSHP